MAKRKKTADIEPQECRSKKKKIVDQNLLYYFFTNSQLIKSFQDFFMDSNSDVFFTLAAGMC